MPQKPATAARNLAEFGQGRGSNRIRPFRVLLRRRRLLADGVPVELGARAFDLLLVLLHADGALVTKQTLLDRVWRGIFVSEENLKVQISALRKALGSAPQPHPYGIRPRLSVHRHIAPERHCPRLPRTLASKLAG